MDLREGFIVGIFNYCDHWCATCDFTSWCRLFADSAACDASRDPAFHEITRAPLLPQDVSPPPPRWMQELIEEMNDVADQAESAGEEMAMRPAMAPQHDVIQARGRQYCLAVHAWLQTQERFASDPATDPRAVIAWYHTAITAKVYRALTGLAAKDDDDDLEPQDYDGSAKVALLGIDRSLAAWQETVNRGLATALEAAPFVRDLAWLRARLEQVFPAARAFVRPGFDEPEAVARLRTAEE